VPTKRARFGFRGRFAVVRSNLQFTPTERLRLRRLCPAPGFGRDVRDLARWYRECSDDVASYSESPREAELALRALHADVLAIDRKPASLPARVRFMERFGSLSATAEAFLKVGLYSVGLYGAPLTDLGAIDAAMRAAWAAGLAAGADAAASEKGRHVQRGAHLERGIARPLAAIFAEYGVRFYRGKLRPRNGGRKNPRFRDAGERARHPCPPRAVRHPIEEDTTIGRGQKAHEEQEYEAPPRARAVLAHAAG
jgi:hypothetical protein